MYTYKDLETETKFSKRYYITPRGSYPSITTILGTTHPPEKVKALEGWRNSLGHAKADAVSKKATDHGTNVHLLIERHLKGEQVDAPINGEPVPYNDFKAYSALKLKLKNITEVWGQEVPLYSDSIEVAGRCDFVGKYKDTPVIIDFKTSSKVKSDKDIFDYKLQLSFYAIAHNEMFNTNIEHGVILMVAETGFPLEFHIKLSDYYEDLGKRIEKFRETLINKQ
jgi:genome maintenance exonuclease 1